MKNNISQNRLYIELAPVISKLNLILVDVQLSEQHVSNQVRMVIKAITGSTSIEDCTKVHKTVEPRLGLLLNDKDLQLEVSTPGMLRNLKDAYEFTVFNGERVKLYLESRQDWIAGIIKESDELSVTIEQLDSEKRVSGKDRNNHTMERNMIQIPFNDIKKAKLDIIWEGNR